MKRLVVCLLFLSAAIFVFAQNAETVLEASITEMTGTVEIKKPGSENWSAAKTGDRLEKASVISTGFKSTAILSVGNSTIVVRPLTRLSLEELVGQENAETVNVALRTGRVQVNVTPPAGSRIDLSIRTPAVTASVRGTTFEMDPVNISVSDGVVSYEYAAGQGTSRPVLVSAGQRSRADGGRIVNPVTIIQESLSLPELPGQEAMARAEFMARLEPYMGSANIPIDVYEENYE